MPDVPAVISWLVQTLLASGFAIVGFVALRSTAIGERFLSHHFERRIAELRHSQNEAIESLRADLAHVGDRGRRANEREFEALSRIWGAFVDAFLKTNQAVVAYSSFPNLDELSQEDLAAYLEASELSAAQRKQVLDAEKKVDMYVKIVEFRQINAAAASIFDARLLLRRDGIFAKTDVIDAFTTALNFLGKAQIERSMHFQHRATDIGYDETLRLFGEGEKVFASLQSLLRTRLLRD
jgi:hypothetical protein